MVGCLALACVRGQIEAPAKPEPPEPVARDAAPAPAGSETAQGRTTVKLGAVEVDAQARRLIIPAQVNMVEKPIEYLLVSALGKLHESIFKTEAEPNHVHAAALLLLPPHFSPGTPAKVQITIELPGGRTIPAESAVLDFGSGQAMAPGTWSYLGSRHSEGVFLAQQDGSIISVIGDPDALIESGRVARENDENWRPLAKNLPAVGTAVRVLLEFEKPRP